MDTDVLEHVQLVSPSWLEAGAWDSWVVQLGGHLPGAGGWTRDLQSPRPTSVSRWFVFGPSMSSLTVQFMS